MSRYTCEATNRNVKKARRVVSDRSTCTGYANVDDLRKAAKCVYLATDEAVAKDLAEKLNGAANMIDALQDFVIWMTGCGYDFCQHDYFCKQRDELLKA